ncbi:hypothetical protein PDJAM_G00220410 [Pangasius djambal]|uniref:Uncharacterized protein n=1 Tax=Pangasius djambal TaxID=1691987 RepID=A0ACC5YC24_9TELE|nr:hypothetical protein [Pangasius djambal]
MLDRSEEAMGDFRRTAFRRKARSGGSDEQPEEHTALQASPYWSWVTLLLTPALLLLQMQYIILQLHSCALQFVIADTLENP